jgi:hypothetical protein
MPRYEVLLEVIRLEPNRLMSRYMERAKNLWWKDGLSVSAGIGGLEGDFLCWHGFRRNYRRTRHVHYR